jgi:hypothetical protein
MHSISNYFLNLFEIPQLVFTPIWENLFTQNTTTAFKMFVAAMLKSGRDGDDLLLTVSNII